MIAALAVEMGVAPKDLMDDDETATSPEMVATLVNYLNWRAAEMKRR